jgi:hypothetical protein
MQEELQAKDSKIKRLESKLKSKEAEAIEQISQLEAMNTSEKEENLRLVNQIQDLRSVLLSLENQFKLKDPKSKKHEVYKNSLLINPNPVIHHSCDQQKNSENTRDSEQVNALKLFLQLLQNELNNLSKENSELKEIIKKHRDLETLLDHTHIMYQEKKAIAKELHEIISIK